MWQKIRRHKYNRFQKVKSQVALNNLHTCNKNKLYRKCFKTLKYSLFFNNSTKNMPKKIRWYKYNRFKISKN